MKYIKRHIDKSLAEWKSTAQHKPLLLRGTTFSRPVRDGM
jgi:hypothetical protein